jgi:hypothetical protein
MFPPLGQDLDKNSGKPAMTDEPTPTPRNLPNYLSPFLQRYLSLFLQRYLSLLARRARPAECIALLPQSGRSREINVFDKLSRAAVEAARKNFGMKDRRTTQARRVTNSEQEMVTIIEKNDRETRHDR